MDGVAVNERMVEVNHKERLLLMATDLIREAYELGYQEGMNAAYDAVFGDVEPDMPLPG